MTTITEPRMTPTAVRILHAAADLFYAHGLRAVGVERIAEEAGTTKKTIYDRFGSKDGLITAYLRRRRDLWHAHVIDHLDQRHPEASRERVLGTLDALETWMAESSRGCGFVNAYAELGGTGHEALPFIAQEKAWTNEHYTRLLAELDVPEAERRGRELAMVQDGVVVQLTAGARRHAMSDARALMGRLLDEGLAARDAKHGSGATGTVG